MTDILSDSGYMLMSTHWDVAVVVVVGADVVVVVSVIYTGC